MRVGGAPLSRLALALAPYEVQAPPTPQTHPLTHPPSHRALPAGDHLPFSRPSTHLPPTLLQPSDTDRFSLPFVIFPDTHRRRAQIRIGRPAHEIRREVAIRGIPPSRSLPPPRTPAAARIPSRRPPPPGCD